MLHTLAVLAEARGEDVAALEQAIDRNAERRLRAPGAVSGPQPKKSLGQHFLVDDNILGVIARLAELDAADVVLEIGPGLGVLTRVLAEQLRPRSRRRARPSARAASPRRSPLRRTSTLHWGDALRLDLGELRRRRRRSSSRTSRTTSPRPIVAESLDGLPAIELWCVMVQREVADRFFAVPSTKAYGAVSVLIQLAATRTGFHPVSRTVFRPPPNVDSALVAFRRTALPPRLRRAPPKVVEGAFAHRRKTLANSLQLAGVATREQAVAALAALGLDPAVRAEALAPPVFVELARLLR